MLNSHHPEITKFVLKYYDNARSPIRDELIQKINDGETVHHCKVPVALSDKPNPDYRHYPGLLFERDGKQLALVSDFMDYSQDVLIDVSQLDKAPTISKPASLENIKPFHKKDVNIRNMNDFYRKMETDYVQSLYSTCSSLMNQYVTLRNKIDLPKIDDPLLSEMIKWKKTNSYQKDHMHEYKHLLMKGLTTIANINFLLDKQRDILPHVLSQITLPQEGFNITRGGLDAFNEDIGRFSVIAEYGFEIAVHVPDDDTVEYIITNHSHEEVARITDASGFETRTAELNGETYEVLCYELDADYLDEFTVSGKLSHMPEQLKTVFEALATSSTHEGLRLVSMNNPADAIYAAVESSRRNDKPCIALRDDTLASEWLMEEVSRHQPQFSTITRTFAASHADFTIPALTQPKQEPALDSYEPTF